MPTPQPTLDELVNTLKRSSLPTIIVEGDDDMQIYRWMEKRLGSIDADILPVGGRDNVFKLYERRNEFPNLKVVYLADKDMYVFASIPEEYNDINVIFTSGYSIENDMIVGSMHFIERLFDKNEARQFDEILNNIIPWFSFEVQNYKNAKPHNVDNHINVIIPNGSGSNNVSPAFLAAIGFVPVEQELIEEVSHNFILKIRGKLLLQILERVLLHKKYKDFQLIEIMVKFGDNEFLDSIVERIRSRLTA